MKSAKTIVYACRGEAPDAWAYREFLPKPWQDLITMRVLIRGPTPSRRTAGGSMPQGNFHFAAKWQMPHSDSVQAFAVTERMLVQC